MVIEDPNLPQINPSKPAHAGEHRMAQPLDRLAAFVVDGLVILTPLVVLSLAPMKRLMVESLLLHEDSAFSILLFAMILMGVVLVVTYQTVLVASRGATIGKSLLGLRVVDVWTGKKPSRLSAFIRAIGWLVDCVLLFIPHLETLTNHKRRPLHDRIAETVVVTERNKPALSPGVLESAFVRGIISAFVVFLVTIFVGQIFMILSELRNESVAVNEDCELDVREDQDRLSVALRDFAAGHIEAKCLEKEATDEMQGRHPRMDLVYLAQSFAHSGDADVSNRYLEQVCETNAEGSACVMSKVIEAWSDENWKKVDQYLNFDTLPDEPYLQVWALRHYLKQEEFAQAQVLTERLQTEKPLRSFLLTQKVKSLWGLNEKDRARDLASVALSTDEESLKHQVSQFICYEELMDSCEKKSASCDWLSGYYEEHDFDQEDIKDSLAFFRLSQCTKEEDHVEKWVPHLQNENLRSLIQSVAHLKEDRVNARAQLMDLFLNPESTDSIKREAVYHWTQSAKKPEELEPLFKEYVQLPKTVVWAKVGRELFQAYFQRGAYQRAVDVGMKMLNTRWSNAEFLKKMTVASYNMGWRKEAYALLKASVSDDGRKPASQDEFSVIRRNLEKEFGSL